LVVVVGSKNEKIVVTTNTIANTKANGAKEPLFSAPTFGTMVSASLSGVSDFFLDSFRDLGWSNSESPLASILLAIPASLFLDPIFLIAYSNF
jgi:hypothetical protein